MSRNVLGTNTYRTNACGGTTTGGTTTRGTTTRGDNLRRQPRRRDAAFIRTGVGSAVIALAACVIAQTAVAHAFLERAVPTVGSDAATSPSSLLLTYPEAVEPAFISAEVTDTHGNRVDQGSLTTQKGAVSGGRAETADGRCLRR